MAVIANSDALRFHRDRLVNEYRQLNNHELAVSDWQVVQDLTLIDWDMQPGTASGTAFDHPDGDRYLFLLQPGEVVGLFFAEPPTPPGPMMMPYHCALPVFDLAASETVGPAKGKRLSALTRGLAPDHEVAELIANAVELEIDGVRAIEGGNRIYDSGVSVTTHDQLPATRLVPIDLVPGAAEGVGVTKLSVEANEELLRRITGEAAVDGYDFFHIEKYGEGFSDLRRVLPRLIEARDVYILNRSLNGPQCGVSFPVAFDRVAHGKPWIQLLRLQDDDMVRLPSAVVPMLRLTPTDHLLHRSAPLDSFYPSPIEQPRMACVVEIAFR